MSHEAFANFDRARSFAINVSSDLENYWLSGFSDAAASFQIKLLERGTKREVRLNYQVDQKGEAVLLFLKNYLGGNVGYRATRDTYYYGSTSFGSARSVVNYFDRFHLLSSKHTNYLKWRQVYLLVQRGGHLSVEGWNKISKLKRTMNRLSDEPQFKIES